MIMVLFNISDSLQQSVSEEQTATILHGPEHEVISAPARFHCITNIHTHVEGQVYS